MRNEMRARLRPGEYYRIFVSVLIAGVGMVILARALLLGLSSPNVFLIGAAFSGLGLYRLWLIRRVLSDRQGKAAAKEGEAHGPGA